MHAIKAEKRKDEEIKQNENILQPINSGKHQNKPKLVGIVYKRSLRTF